MEGVRKRARVMALEIARQSVGGTGKAIRTWAIARYYVDVRDVSSIILIAEITAASTAPAALSPYFSPSSPFPAHTSRRTRRIFSHITYFRVKYLPGKPVDYVDNTEICPAIIQFVSLYNNCQRKRGGRTLFMKYFVLFI